MGKVLNCLISTPRKRFVTRKFEKYHGNEIEKRKKKEQKGNIQLKYHTNNL